MLLLATFHAIRVNYACDTAFSSRQHVYNSHIRVRKDDNNAASKLKPAVENDVTRNQPHLFIPPIPWHMPRHDCAGLSLRPVASVYCPVRSAGSECTTRQYSTWRSVIVTHCSSRGQPLEMNRVIRKR